MRWLAIVTVAAVVLAVAEIAAFVVVAKAIGVGWAIGVGLLTTLIGTWLLRREGVRGWRRFRVALDEGRAPGNEASDGLIGLLGALLLIMPGFVGDVVGLVLLAPPVRALARHGVRRVTERRVSSAVAGGVFGARRVRAYRGRPVPDPAPAAGHAAYPDAPDRPRTAIEGEIVQPDERA